MQKIHVIHEHSEWTAPLLAALDAQGLPHEDWFLGNGALDLSGAPPEGGTSHSNHRAPPFSTTLPTPAKAYSVSAKSATYSADAV